MKMRRVFGVEDAVIEGAAGRARNLDHADGFQRRDGFMSLRLRVLLLEFRPCAISSERPSVAQSLDGERRLAGSLCFPVARNLAAGSGCGKVSVAVSDQYFGRCEFAHSRACSIGRRGTAARTFCVAGRLSIRSRHRQNAGKFRIHRLSLGGQAERKGARQQIEIRDRRARRRAGIVSRAQARVRQPRAPFRPWAAHAPRPFRRRQCRVRETPGAHASRGRSCTGSSRN